MLDVEIKVDVDSNGEKKQFTTFYDTYKKLTFVMALSMIYPNPKVVKRHVISIILMFIPLTPLTFMVIYDSLNCLKNRDILNLIRHGTILFPFLIGFIKLFLMNYKVNGAKAIIDEIDSDYASYNDLPQNYQAVVKSSLEGNKTFIEYGWMTVVVFCVMTFPAMATFQNIYNSLFKSEPKLYMMHDLNIPFKPPEARFETPAFELMSAYMVCAAFMFVLMYIGTDGFFGICINHGCLKMQLYCKMFDDALKENSEEEMRRKIVEVIKEQNKLTYFMDRIQDTFNIWLGIILVATMVQICTCLYQITEGLGLDMRYVIFMTGSIIHIYLPCRYSSKIQFMSTETATLFYRAQWEDVPSIKIRKLVLFMIARAQNRIEITAFNLKVFDMDLFVKILNSSYSMYTLIRS